MRSNIFVNISTKNLDQSKNFFLGLGFQLNPKFTDQNAACIVVNENIFVMIITEDFLKKFTKKNIIDAHHFTETIISLSVENKETVDELIKKAISMGATENIVPEMQQGGMYGRSINDLDGHIWEIFWMDTNIINQ